MRGILLKKRVGLSTLWAGWGVGGRKWGGSENKAGGLEREHTDRGVKAKWHKVPGEMNLVNWGRKARLKNGMGKSGRGSL